MVKTDVKQRIIEAAMALVAEGIEDPTNDQVREKLGGGSLSHISPVMREWRSSRKEAVVAALEIPADLKKVIEISLSQVWNTANKIAFSTVDTIQKESDALINEANTERDEALQEVQRLERYIQSLENALNSKEVEIKQLLSDKQLLESDLLGAVKDRDSQNILLADRKEQIQNLNNNVKELQSQLVQIVSGKDTSEAKSKN